jgi:hypothetical protein
VDEYTVSPAGDPFYAAPHDQDHPHACLDGYVFLEYTAFDEKSGEEVERVEALPCRRCLDDGVAVATRNRWSQPGSGILVGCPGP